MGKYRAGCTILLFIVFAASMMSQHKFNNRRAPVSNQRSGIHNTDVHVQSLMAGNMAFGWSAWNFNIVSLPIPSGTPVTNITPWTPPNGDFASSAVRGGDGNYYVVCMGPPSSLWQMDPGTGEIMKIGSIIGLGTETVNGITYNPVNQKYYLAAGDYMLTNNLYSFDVYTLTANLIASFPNSTGIMVDIAIDSLGVGYGYDLTNDSSYTFDPVTGITTPLGPLGFDCNYGQGMDVDLASNTIYLASYNNTTFTGQLRILNPVTGAAALVVDWGEEQIAPFAINNEYVVPGPGPAANPIPPNKGTNVDVIAQLSWTNPAGAASINVMFGPSPDSMSSIYSGAPVTTADPGLMSFYSQYYWRIDETDQTGTTFGPLWSFTTKVGPNVPLHDTFDSLANWNFAGPFGSDSNWVVSNTNFAGGMSSPELQLNWYPEFNGASYLLSDPITVTTGHNLELRFTNYFEIWDFLVGHIGVAVTTDGGSTYTTVFDTLPPGTYGPEVQINNFIGTDGMQIAFYYSGNSTAFTIWAIDDLLLTDLDYNPVEVEENIKLPFQYWLGQNYPNPFNPVTKINYSLKTDSRVTIKVFNILGQEIATILNGSIGAGNHTVTFDASKLSSGVYLYKIEANGADGSIFTSIKKMILAK